MCLPRLLVLISILATRAWAQDVTPAPPDIVHDGVPPIPTSIRASAYRYRTYSGSSFIGWDPTRPQPIVPGYFAGSYQAGVIRNPGERPELFAPLPDGYDEIYMEPGGKYFLYVKERGENSQPQIYRYDIDTKTSALLTDGTSRNRYPIWSTSSKWIAYSSSRRDGVDLDVYVMDPLDPKTNHMVAEVSGGDWAPFAWSPDDRELILSDSHGFNETYLWLLDLHSGKRTLLTPAQRGQKAFNGSYAFFSRDGKGIYVSTDRDSEFRRLSYLELATGKLRCLAPNIPWDVDEFALSPDRKTLAFVSNEDGIGRLHIMETAAYREVPVPALPGAGIILSGPSSGVVPGLQWHQSLPYVGFVFDSVKNPAELFSLNIATGKLERWTTAAKAVETAELRDPEFIKWKSFDGTTIPGYLYRPPDSFAGKRPVIVDLHAGPVGQARPAFRGEDNYFINALGVAMIYPNVRGSSGYGKTFMGLDDGPLRLNATSDVGALLEWIAARPELDPSRVMLRGASYGGYLALSAASMYSHRICGVISYVGPTNLATFIERSDYNDQVEWRNEIGDERDRKTREFLDAIAPASNADKIRRPAFLMIGGKDRMVSVAETEHIVSKLKNNRVPVWYLLAKDEGHGFGNWDNSAYASDAEILFIRRFLLGDLSSDSSVDASAGSSRTDSEPTAWAPTNQGRTAVHLPTVDEVLDKYVLAIGGRAAILSIRSSVSRGTLDIPATGFHADFEYWREAPNKLEYQLVVSDSMTTRTVFDGIAGWSDSIEAGVKPIEGEALSGIKRSADFYPSLHLKDLYPKLTVSGIERTGDAEAFEIEAIRVDQKPARLFFDVRTGLLVRADFVAPDGDVQEYLSDYREVDGVKTPFTAKFVYKLYTTITKLKEISNNVPVDESRFARPSSAN
jgi:dipeptidyl aminopeptidase/acylaminoacyl peptidase